MKKVGLWLAIAALLVNGPRFILIFLRVDNIDIPLQTEAIMLGATGLATGLVLTGGGAYIAHTLAESKVRGVTQFVMVTCWFLLLVFSVILLAPLMVASIRVSSLQSVFTSNISQWVWGITSVTSIEVIAAAAMAAYAQEGKSQDEVRADKTSAASILTGALVRRLETQIAPQQLSHSLADPGEDFVANQAANDGKIVTQSLAQSKQPEYEISSAHGSVNGNGSREPQSTSRSKSERQKMLLGLLEPLKTEAEISVDRLANLLGVSRQTIYRDLDQLKSQQLLQIEDGRVQTYVDPA